MWSWGLISLRNSKSCCYSLCNIWLSLLNNNRKHHAVCRSMVLHTCIIHYIWPKDSKNKFCILIRLTNDELWYFNIMHFYCTWIKASQQKYRLPHMWYYSFPPMVLSRTTTYKQPSCCLQILFQLYQALVAYQKCWNVKPSACKTFTPCWTFVQQGMSLICCCSFG